MKSHSAILLVAALCCVPVEGLAQSVETELAGVKAEVVELRSASGLTRLAVRFTNSGTAAEDSARYTAERITLVDAKSKRKHFPMKDTTGQYLAGPIGDRIDGGRVRLFIPARGSTVVWAYFEGVPAGTVVNVEMPLVFPFENVRVSDEAGAVFGQAVAKSTPGGAAATLVSARRADQMLNVRLRLEPERGASVHLGSPYFEFKDVFLLDPVAKRKYPLLKDSDGNFQAQPNTVRIDGGSFVPEWSRATLVSLTFAAPPDAVTRVDLFLPHFLPFESIAIEGLGGAGAGGIATSGKATGLEGALKDLNAEVTAAEIKIALAADVLFDFDKASLRKEAATALQNVAIVLKANPGATVMIEGHTDAKGTDAYNQTLSEQRAAAVKQWLVGNAQASGATITTRGMGKTKPVAHNTKPDGSDDPDGRAKNRRVEIVVKKG